MKIQVTGRHLSITPAIQTYVEEKISKAQKFFSNIIWVQVLLAVEKRVHRAEVIVHASKQTFRALGTGDSLYAAIDLSSDKIDAQLRKYKERLKGRHKSAPAASEVAAWPASADGRAVRFSVIKRVQLMPMSAEAAAQEMDRMGFNFWMFEDESSRQVNVIFRRLDDSFGLLQPARRE